MADHDVEEVTAALLEAMAAEVALRRAHTRDTAGYAARLEAVRVLLGS